MLPITSVGITPSELNRLVEGQIWERWIETEPALSRVASLDELHALRGLSADEPLGALVRLAAKSGGDDELAGIAVVHQLEGGVRHLARALADQSGDIEAIVVGALWERIRTFPWRRRRRAYAANLMLDTKAAVMRLLQPGRTKRGPEPVVLVDFTSGRLDELTAMHDRLRPSDEDEQARTDLLSLLDWAQATRAISRADVLLLVELIQAGHEVADQETPQRLRGVCSEAAMLRVAAKRGVSSKTILRRRNRVVGALREVAPRYLCEVA